MKELPSKGFLVRMTPSPLINSVTANAQRSYCCTNDSTPHILVDEPVCELRRRFQALQKKQGVWDIASLPLKRKALADLYGSAPPSTWDREQRARDVKR